jgi:hypothetical protein
MNHWCGSHCNNVEVTVLLIFLSVRSHEGPLSSLLFLVEGFLFGPNWLDVSMLSYHHTQSFVVMGFTGFETPCVIVHCFTWVWVCSCY